MGRLPWLLVVLSVLSVASIAARGTTAAPRPSQTLTAVPAGTIKEFSIPTGAAEGTTHEIDYSPKGDSGLWITNQDADLVANLTLDGTVSEYPMPPGSGPHGLAFDPAGHLWVTFEFLGAVAQLDLHGHIVAQYDVRLDCAGCAEKINTHPHGLAIDPDGRTVWFTGKATGTLGKITPDGHVETFPLTTVDSVPIYLSAGPDGNMWFTELVGNAVGRITPDGHVQEFPIPTTNSRPIAIIPDPRGQAMWFTEEAGNRVGRVSLDGSIAEYPVPMTQPNVILAALAFDGDQNLWVEQYVDANNPDPAGPDHVIRIDRSILATPAGQISGVPMSFYEVPTRDTVLHRIIRGPDGNMWFTELAANKVGEVIISP